MNTFDLQYIAKICPELTKAECEVVYDEVLVDYRPEDVYAQAVRCKAESLFPYVLRSHSVSYMDGRNHARTAYDLMCNADKSIDRMRSKSDEMAQIQLDIRAVIYYLSEELDKMEAPANAN